MVCSENFIPNQILFLDKIIFKVFLRLKFGEKLSGSSTGPKEPIPGFIASNRKAALDTYLTRRSTDWVLDGYLGTERGECFRLSSSSLLILTVRTGS